MHIESRKQSNEREKCIKNSRQAQFWGKKGKEKIDIEREREKEVEKESEMRERKETHCVINKSFTEKLN